MANVTEVAPDVFRIGTYASQKALQFNQFLVVDEQPLLFHTGQRAIFPEVREAVGRLIDPTRLRWIGFSHFEMDECGSLNEWLALAPDAAPLCGQLSARLNVNDFALRPAHAMADDDVLVTGRYHFRFRRTPHVPHCWDAGLLFEETERTLLCSDLFLQQGDPAAFTESDVVEPTQATLAAWQGTLLAEVMPYTPNTERILHDLADLRPRTLAAMHGATFSGDGERALRDLALSLRAVYGPPTGYQGDGVWVSQLC
jgi:flavorubredoxin